MSRQLFRVFLVKETPQQFIDLFPEYIESWRGSNSLLSTTFNCSHPFSELSLIPIADDGMVVKVRLPMHYILTILDFGEDNPPLGFGVGNK